MTAKEREGGALYIDHIKTDVVGDLFIEIEGGPAFGVRKGEKGYLIEMARLNIDDELVLPEEFRRKLLINEVMK